MLQNSTKESAIIPKSKGGNIVVSKILRGVEKDGFCKELGLNNEILEILLKIENNKASYFDGKDYYAIDLETAKKYI